ncbi:TlpA family protein disulfide reductase [Streptomyces sp. NPDC060048]|uniref:TlpA family protein disulfide reductase n=1 Tax=unclassified Streptomyces TaxID=2593676 RepID=UPI00367B05D9
MGGYGDGRTYDGGTGRGAARIGGTATTATGARVRGHEGHGDGRRLGAAELGAEPGERATLLQFSSAFCQPCRATRRILAEVAAMVDGVAHIEIDAEKNLDLVRALGIEKTPTVLVLDAAGRIVRRAAGMPRKADVIAALGAAV